MSEPPVEQEAPEDVAPDGGPIVPEPARKKPPVEVVWASVRDYFVGEPPTFWVAMVPTLILAAVLFTRHPQTNCIFDEQEALLANPYVNGKQGLGWLDAFHRDFWGLPPDRSVGSYRPIPDIVWRLVWTVAKNPWLAHWINVLLHAANGACMVVLAYTLTRRTGYAWLVGAIFTAAAVITEAVSGVVGIADVMGGLGAILALLALRLPLGVMPFAVIASVMFGLFCKESALVCVPLIPLAALYLAPVTHPEKPRRVVRSLVALIATVVAFVAYVEIRKKVFPAPMEATLSEPLPEGATAIHRGVRAFMVWFHQPPLPHDPLNNPLVKADTPHRVAGALRVYFRGLVQVVVPHTLSGDYSAPQEPIPKSLFEPEILLGALFMAVPPFASVVLWARGLLRERSERRRWSVVAEDADDPTRQRARALGALNVALGAAWLGGGVAFTQVPSLVAHAHGGRVVLAYAALLGGLVQLAFGVTQLVVRVVTRSWTSPEGEARPFGLFDRDVVDNRNLPLIAVCGRPNVGKSTLFNRLTGSRRSIVGDEPGITRDRIYGEIEWMGRDARIVDTGGVVPDDEALIPSEIFRQLTSR